MFYICITNNNKDSVFSNTPLKMTEIVIERKTVKEQMNDVLLDMAVGDQFPIDRSDRGKWATHISNHVHPYQERRYSVITDRDATPEGKAIIRRTK